MRILKIKKRHSQEGAKRELLQLVKKSEMMRELCELNFDKILVGQAEYLSRISDKPLEELVILSQELDIKFSDMNIFYMHMGFLPSPGFSIGIKHLGVELVIECLQENLPKSM